MATTKDNDGDYWGYLITKDKTAAPLLEQLCLGLYRILKKEGRGPDNQLTPERLANFYHNVGGNLDPLFIAKGDSGSSPGYNYNHGLSFIYRTLGCFHTLQPSLNAFDTPKLPCLTASGFVRWQTLQLLLCPQEHSVYMQRAVQVYDIPSNDGRLFPKSIPREAFPDKPDAEMERWHQKISLKLTDDLARTAKNSPYASPMPQPGNRDESYFASNVPEIRKPARPSREREDRSRSVNSSRRSSGPDGDVNLSPSERTRPSSAYYGDDQRRSASANRSTYAARPRSATTGYTPQQRQTSTSSPRDQYERYPRSSQRPSPYSRPSPSRRYRTPAVDDDDSGGEASGEESMVSRRHRSRDSSQRDGYVRRNLLAPVLDMLPGRRRHSSDASAYYDRNDSRRRDDSRPRSARVSPGEAPGRQQTVHFRQDVFDDDQSRGPDSPVYDGRVSSHGRRSGDNMYPAGRLNGRDSSGSGSGSEIRPRHDSHSRRSRDKDVPLRVSTVTGVHGRRYANVEPHNPSSHGPSGPSANLANQDPRMRYSVTAV